MLQRDYILRLVREFTEALEKLIEEKKKKDIPEVQVQIESIYRAYFHHPHTFYYEQPVEYILNELAQTYQGEDLLQRVDMLAELMYQDALLKPEEEQDYLFGKSLYLWKYLDANSDTFSWERRRKIIELEGKNG